MEKVLIVCTPGLEKAVLQELKETWSFLLTPQGTRQVQEFPEVEFHKGGIEVPCSFFQAVQLNFFLKMATRILWRLGEFRCRDFPKLFQNLKKVPWTQWLPTSKIKWHIAAARSRLNNEKRIREVAEEVLKSVSLPAVSDFTSDVYIRFYDDVGTVSLDLSGEPLYKRILNKGVGEAPFRETWAHFVLRKMIGDEPLARLRQIDLVDPFCGSGTFLMEAQFLLMPNFHREFSFLHLPRCPKLFKSPQFALNYRWPKDPLWRTLRGQDQNSQMMEVAQENLKSYQSLYQWEAPGFEFSVRDAFERDPVVQSSCWVVANPPWGQRLVKSQSFEKLVENLLTTWKAQKMALVLPGGSLKDSAISSNYKTAEKYSLELGGSPVDLWIGTDPL